MGVYMVIIASVDLYYRGVYIYNSHRWRNSSLCQLAGVLATVSSEVSVLSLCVLTVDRLLAICFPLSLKRLNVRTAKAAIAAVWSIGIAIAIIPLLPIEYFNGTYYARSGVCISLHLTADESPGWEYSVFVYVILNLLAFLLIASGYLVMYGKIKSSMVAAGQQQLQNEIALARKMTLIVITDFCCWVPIITLSMMAWAGYAISGDVYSWIIVFVLPVNSSINPYLYTFGDIKTMLARRRKASESSHRQPTQSVAMTERDTVHKRLVQSNIIIAESTGHLSKVTPLQEVLDKKSLTVRDIFVIMKKIIFSIRNLHDNGMAVEGLDKQSIYVFYNDMSIQDIYLCCCPIEPADLRAHVQEDILAVGKLLRTMLRTYAKTPSAMN